MFMGLIAGGGAACAQDEAAIRRNLRALLSVAASIGVQYEWTEQRVVEGQLVVGETNRRAYFVGGSTSQLVLNMAEGAKIGVDLPLHKGNLNTVARETEVFSTKLDPKWMANLDFKYNQISGPCIYRESSNWASFPIEPTVPAVNAGRNGRVVDLLQPADIVFDKDRTWRKIESERGVSFAIDLTDKNGAIEKWPHKTSKGKAIWTINTVVVNFESSNSNLPREIYKITEYEIDGNRYPFPIDLNSESYVLSDWREVSPGVIYPFAHRIEFHDTGMSMEDFLNEDKGYLGDFVNGKFRCSNNLYKAIDIRVIDVQRFPPSQSFFISPPPGNYATNMDTHELYITGVSKEESDKILGLAPPDPIQPKTWGATRWLFASVNVLIMIYLIRRYIGKRSEAIGPSKSAKL